MAKKVTLKQVSHWYELRSCGHWFDRGIRKPKVDSTDQPCLTCTLRMLKKLEEANQLFTKFMQEATKAGFTDTQAELMYRWFALKDHRTLERAHWLVAAAWSRCTNT